MTDTYWQNVSILNHFNGTNGSTYIPGAEGKVLTPFGGAQLSTAQKQFGTSSLYLNGVSQSYVTNTSSDFTLRNR